MVKEELYIIVDGERKQLDLLSPSGITLNFVSNLFNDLSKINASYSYTFKLPRTANNVRVLEIVDDVRADGKFTRIKNDAEYVYDGVSLFSNANMYISGVEKESISAVMTWNVNKGLQELEKHDMSLQELGNHLSEGEYNYIYSVAALDERETDKVVHVGDFSLLGDYNSHQPSFCSLHSAGVNPYWREEPYVDADTHKISTLPPLTIDEEYPEKCAIGTATDNPLKYRTTYAYPAPVVPVPYIIDTISKVFNIDIDFFGDLYESLCVPLICNKVSNGLSRLNYISLTVRNNNSRSYLLLDGHIVNNYPNINPILLGASSEAEWTNAMLINLHMRGLDVQRTETKYKIGGRIKIDTTGIGSGDDTSDVKIIVYGVTWSSLNIADADLVEIGKIEARYDYEYFENTVRHLVAVFDMEESNGCEVFETDTIYRDGFMLRLVHGENESDFGDYSIYSCEGELKVYIVPTNYVYGVEVNLFSNLPDVSCLDFVKSICYALGGYPYQDASGKIMLQEYSNIIERINNGGIADWSAKTIKSLGENNEDLNFDDSSVTGLTLAKKNYFLMKNDKLDDYGKEEQNDKLKDAYKHGYYCISVNSELLEGVQTLFTFPFYGCFLWSEGFYSQAVYSDSHYDAPDTRTYFGQDIWHISKFKYNTVFYKSGESKPMLGIVDKISVAEYDTDYYGTTEEEQQDETILHSQHGAPTGNYIDYLSIRVWNCATDMPKVNGHDLLQELFGNPCLVKEEMNLNVADLVSLDMEKPVFLEKYNSYFAIKNIEVSSSDGISKVELIRIPTEILEPAAPTPEVIVEPPTVEPTEPEPSGESELSASD